MGQEQQAQQLAQGGIDPYTSLWSQYAPGAQTYWDALGVGGGAGADAASAAFGASPFGRQLQANLATTGEALARGAGTTGQTGQGYIQGAQAVTGLTDQAMQQWLQSLSPAISGQQTAAQGLQAGSEFAAGIPSQFAPEIAGVQTGQGTSLANIYGQNAQQLAQAQQAAGQGIGAAYGQFAPLQSQINWQGILGPAQARIQGADAAAQAQATGQQNTINALMAAGKLIAAPFTGGATLAGGTGGLFNVGGGGGGFSNPFAAGGAGSTVGPSGSYVGDPFGIFGQ
jgi:hypothetical protein